MITFDPNTHTYSIEGVGQVPGTSAILRVAGLIPDMGRCPAYAAKRGTMVHRYTESMDKGENGGVGTCPPPLRGYVEAWQRLKDDTGMEILGIEELRGCSVLKFATMIDRRVRWRGEEWVLNLKTGGKFPHYRYQSALESMLYAHKVRRASVYLPTHGLAKLEEYSDPKDIAVARAAIKTYWEKRT